MTGNYERDTSGGRVLVTRYGSKAKGGREGVKVPALPFPPPPPPPPPPPSPPPPSPPSSSSDTQGQRGNS
ncbi:hypothetical protein E2C01_022983 [Portunus trituberculatus]|uniref:Uncharacterized protein n=1 Tax=Portunus trituberculatus TaxID=210409 RepID=A0A5B7EAC6_PORTR|nr:hypothetical protein [Portunus trituberculatus]